MEAVTLGVAQRWIEESESTLRDAYRMAGLPFPAEWEVLLEQHPATALLPALQRWALLKHFYRLRAAAQSVTPEEAREAAQRLLRREPVQVRLAGRLVAVTGRSYNALVQIIAHHLRMSELRAAVERIEELHSATLLRFRTGIRRGRARRRLAFLADLHSRLLRELLAHRRAFYAHALTGDGAPATLDTLAAHPAPWWPEATADDDALLVGALHEAGRGRYARLGPAPERPSSGREPRFAEDFGIHSLLSWVEEKRRVPPASLYDQDIGQVLTALRAGVLTQPDRADLEA